MFKRTIEILQKIGDYESANKMAGILNTRNREDIPLSRRDQKKYIEKKILPKKDNLSAKLSEREFQVLVIQAEGKQLQQVARELEIVPDTVKRHNNHILKKFGVHSIFQAALKAFEEGIIDSTKITTPDQRKKVLKLSETEYKILSDLATTGASNQELAMKNNIVIDTVKRHMSHIYSKLGFELNYMQVEQKDSYRIKAAGIYLAAKREGLLENFHIPLRTTIQQIQQEEIDTIAMTNHEQRKKILNLPPQQYDLLKRISTTGETNQELGEHFQRTPNSIAGSISHIRHKLEVQDIKDAVIIFSAAKKTGILEGYQPMTTSQRRNSDNILPSIPKALLTKSFEPSHHHPLL